ncbi:S-adenosyl-L-methionine dependent methyltransferase [Peniophora sp. CONT]|nr:S-adenosyl-L-methionine dependent methyltransferase [Peniophora sp. CONT]
MHPRNPYSVPPDFSALAQAYPQLQRHLLQTTSGVTIDFHDELAQRTLTKALLYRDFNLDLSIPGDRLCAKSVWTQRLMQCTKAYDVISLNYVLWIQDILQATSSPEEGTKYGIDIGTGASAIYPLLFCRVVPDCMFVATELDGRSLLSAQENVARNQLSERVRVLPATVNGPILFPVASHQARFSFTMCNPPFYTSAEDILRSAEGKELPPGAVCTGSEVEMITEGGEAAFVCKMVQESLVYRERCQWYTSMLGKLSSITEVVELLREHKIDNYGITEFVQGQTRRWAIAWSFDDRRLPEATGRMTTPTLRHAMPPRTMLREPLPDKPQLCSLRTLIDSIAGASVVEVASDPPALHCSLTANTWTRAARRKQGDEPVISTGRPLLCVKIHVTQDNPSPALEFSWLTGHDHAAFESFSSHVGRKMRSAMAST